MSTTSTLPHPALQPCTLEEPFVHHPSFLLLNDQCKKLPFSQNHQKCSLNENEVENNTSTWNFLVSINNRELTHHDNNSGGMDSVYVHPLARIWSSSSSSSSSSMSLTSLEMCTETLGTESGTYIDPITEEFQLSDPFTQGNNFSNSKTLEKRNERKSTNTITSAPPPPLTSIHGGYCVHILQIHREDGRLVIKASKFPSCRSCFKSERGNGRLRMSRVIKEMVGDVDHDQEEAAIDVSGEKSRIGGKLGLGGDWSSNGSGGRCCNGGEDHQKGNQKLPSFPICVAMS